LHCEFFFGISQQQGDLEKTNTSKLLFVHGYFTKVELASTVMFA